MIISKQKKFETILEFIKDKNNIFLVGCGECAANCHTGGEKEILEMKKRLEDSAKTVTGWAVLESVCVAAQVKMLQAKQREALTNSQAVLVFACGSGAQSFKENDRFKLEVYSGNDTLFAAVCDSQGNFKEVCSNCGDCLLDLTEGICPVTRCAKGLLNGPCGGQKDGKCEVDRTKDCAWILIYKFKKEKDRLKDLAKIIPARDYKKSLKPHIVKVS